MLKNRFLFRLRVATILLAHDLTSTCYFREGTYYWLLRSFEPHIDARGLLFSIDSSNDTLVTAPIFKPTSVTSILMTEGACTKEAPDRASTVDLASALDASC